MNKIRFSFLSTKRNEQHRVVFVIFVVAVIVVIVVAVIVVIVVAIIVIVAVILIGVIAIKIYKANQKALTSRTDWQVKW